MRVTRTGAITRYVTAGLRYPDAIASGPRGSVWFTDYNANAVGEITRTGKSTKPGRPRSLPRVTFIADSVGASLAFDSGAKAIMGNGVDLFLEPGQARTLGPGPPGGIAPPTVLQLDSHSSGAGSGVPSWSRSETTTTRATYAANVEAALTAFRAAGVKARALVSLHVTPDHTSLRNDQRSDRRRRGEPPRTDRSRLECVRGPTPGVVPVGTASTSPVTARAPSRG